MKLRPIIITVSLLGIASLATHYLTRTEPPPLPDSRVGEPLVSAEILEKTAHIRVTDTGKTVDVVRGADGSWKVASYYDLPADFSKITSLTGSLAGGKLDQFIRGTPERLARLEFKDTQVHLLDSSGKEIWSVTLGKTTDNGSRFLKLGTEPNAFASRLNLWLDPESRNWTETSLLKLKPEEILKIALPLPDGKKLELSRAKGSDEWTAADLPAGKVLKKAKITSLLSSLGNLRFSDTVALDDPKVAAAKGVSRSASLTTVDGKTYSLTLNKATPPPPAPKPSPLPGITPSPTPPPPPNPAFVLISSSDANDSINASMTKRAFEVYEFVFNALPASLDELLEAAPVAVPPAPTLAPAEATPTALPAPPK